jgi:hypothetical protein
VKTVNLSTHRIVGNDAMPDLRDLPTKEMDRADGDTGRRWMPRSLRSLSFPRIDYERAAPRRRAPDRRPGPRHEV